MGVDVGHPEAFRELLGDEAPWDDGVVRKAGFNPRDEELAMAYLRKPWNGHPAGSIVVYGLIVRGHPFAIVETRRRVLQSLADAR